jgi:hypothetical protein
VSSPVFYALADGSTESLVSARAEFQTDHDYEKLCKPNMALKLKSSLVRQAQPFVVAAYPRFGESSE